MKRLIVLALFPLLLGAQAITTVPDASLPYLRYPCWSPTLHNWAWCTTDPAGQGQGVSGTWTNIFTTQTWNAIATGTLQWNQL